MSLKLRFIHVNKSGGNSIHSTLNKVSHFDYKQYHDNGRNPIDAKKLEIGTKVLLFVRDPINRFISSYRFMPLQKRLRLFELMERKLKQKFRKWDKEYDLNQLLIALSKTKPMFTRMFLKEYNHLSASISKYLTPETIHELHNGNFWWFVGTTENIQNDFNRLKTMLSNEGIRINAELPHLNKTTRAGKSLSKEAVQYLRKWFEHDYTCLTALVEIGYLSNEYVMNCKTKLNYLY